MGRSWFYIDAWDWVLEGGKYVWKKLTGEIVELNTDEAGSSRTNAKSLLRTDEGITRCFIWQPEPTGTASPQMQPRGYVWADCG